MTDQGQRDGIRHRQGIRRSFADISTVSALAEPGSGVVRDVDAGDAEQDLRPSKWPPEFTIEPATTIVHLTVEKHDVSPKAAN